MDSGMIIQCENHKTNTTYSTARKNVDRFENVDWFSNEIFEISADLLE